jgi:hypothetical protein
MVREGSAQPASPIITPLGWRSPFSLLILAEVPLIDAEILLGPPLSAPYSHRPKTKILRRVRGADRLFERLAHALPAIRGRRGREYANPICHGGDGRFAAEDDPLLRFSITPRLTLISPVRGCGKATVLGLIELLVAEIASLSSA